MSGVSDNQTLLRPDLLARLDTDAALKGQIQTVIDVCADQGIDAYLVVNSLWNPSTQTIAIDETGAFEKGDVKAFAQDLAEVNELTGGNTALSVLVLKSGGLSREAQDNEPGFVGLLDHVLVRLQAQEDVANGSQARVLGYQDIKAASPAHMLVIQAALSEDMDKEYLVTNHLANHSSAWPLDKMQQSAAAMKDHGLPVSGQTLNLMAQWRDVMGASAIDSPVASSSPAPSRSMSF